LTNEFLGGGIIVSVKSFHTYVNKKEQRIIVYMTRKTVNTADKAIAHIPHSGKTVQAESELSMRLQSLTD
jgi:hypothetical protein